MARIDVDALLAPVSDDEPSGRDVDYDPAFGELERTAQGKEEHSMGDAVIPAEPPNWTEVAEQATALFAETKDLRVAVHLTRAATHTSGFPGLADGCRLIHGLLDNFWDGVYPQLDTDDDDDPTLRINSLRPLGSNDAMLRDLGEATLVDTRGVGRYSLRDLRLANGDVRAVDDQVTPDPAHIEAAFRGAELDELTENAEAVEAAHQSMVAIKSLLDEKIGADALVFESLEAELATVKDLYKAKLADRGVGEAGDDEAGESAVGGTEAGGGPSRTIASRDDAIRNIDLICEYFRKHEPSSPVPLLLYRAKRLIAKDFVEILRDLTPGGVDEALLIGGLEDGDDDSSSYGSDE